jgi:SAM-dependent methyltransferase
MSASALSSGEPDPSIDRPSAEELVLDGPAGSPVSVVTMTSNAWADLATDYERARQRSDSLDRILEWPAQRELLGDVTRQRILDVGCGSGAKAVALAEDGATEVIGVDITDAFADQDQENVHLVQGDLSDQASV